MTGVIASVISVSLAARVVGAEGFGVLLILSGVTTLLGVVDLGLGRALIRRVAVLNARDAHGEINSCVSTAVLAAGGSCILGLCITAVAGRILNLPELLNLGPTIDRDGAFVLLMCVSGPFFVALPFSLAASVRLGLQEGYKTGVWVSAGYAIQIVLVVFVAIRKGGMIPFSLALASGAALGTFLDGLALLVKGPVWMEISPSHVGWGHARSLFRVGASFYVIGIAGLVGYQTDVVVIGRALGPSAVTSYGIGYRLFGAIPLGASLFLGALWPAYGDAEARGDYQWVRKAVVRSICIGLGVMVPAGLILAALSGSLVAAWVGNGVVIPTALVWAFVAYVAVTALCGPIAMALNGVGAMRIQVICAVGMMCLNVILSLILVRVVGISGPMWATVGTVATCIVVPTGFVLHRWVKEWGRAD